MRVDMLQFLSGMVAMGFLVCGAFFGRFCIRTKDPLFIAFAIAFPRIADISPRGGAAQVDTTARPPGTSTR